MQIVCKFIPKQNLYMYGVSTAIVLDTRRAKKNDVYPVKLRITYERKQKYFLTKYNLTEEKYENLMFGKKLSDNDKVKREKIYDYESKAVNIINEMPVFTWERFENLYYTDRAAKEFVEKAFNEYIKYLNKAERLGTASSYQCAIHSLELYQKEIKFRDVTINFLENYEKWMLSKGKSISTIGIYLRPLRAIYNKAITDGHLSKEHYPFGKNRYEIPTSKNTKKALKISQIGEIFNYKPVPGSNEEKCRDYWLFMYLCNGMNVKDMCLLQYKNIKGETLEFIRAKTVRTKRIAEPIRIFLLDEVKAIIEKWGNKKRNGDTYIFPELIEGLTKERERKLIQQLTKMINKRMKGIGENLGMEYKITTYFARHSFASVLLRKGKSTEFISEAIGHGDVKTTKTYLAGFDDDEKVEAAKALIAF